MIRLLRFSLLAALLGVPLLTVAPAANAASPASGYEEVAQANPPQARPRQRQRRPRAQAAARRQHQAAQRARRPRAARG